MHGRRDNESGYFPGRWTEILEASLAITTVQADPLVVLLSCTCDTVVSLKSGGNSAGIGHDTFRSILITVKVHAPTLVSLASVSRIKGRV